MNQEQMKKIVDGAPEWAKYWNTRMKSYTKGNFKYNSNIDLDSLRSQLAKHEPMELRARAPRDATHWQQKHDEYWLLSDGVYYLFNEGH